MILEVAVGFTGATVLWFFVWRNNKKKFTGVLSTINKIVNTYNSVAGREIANKVMEVIKRV